MPKNVMISIKPQYVDKILSGSKRIELRKSRMGLSAGDKVWVYTTSPVSSVSLYATIHEIYCEKPSVMWKNHQHFLGCTHTEFIEYCGSREYIFGLRIDDLGNNHLMRYTPFVKRSECPFFHPPQSVLNLDKNKELFEFLLKQPTKQSFFCLLEEFL